MKNFSKKKFNRMYKKELALAIKEQKAKQKEINKSKGGK